MVFADFSAILTPTPPPQLAELLVPNMGQTVDPAMMGALMSACSLINAGAGTEDVIYVFCMLFNDIRCKLKKGGGKGETETVGKTGERGSKEFERK
jgi:hypothetical protein